MTSSRRRAPVLCEWTGPENEGVCGVAFGDISTFSSHVKDHGVRFISQNSAVCPWNGCDFTAAERDTFLQHILFHPFHTFLKVLGAEFQAKFELPACQIDERFKNMVPPIPVPLKCYWNGGMCLKEFEDVGEFFPHVRDHVVQDIGYQCQWKGECKGWWACMYVCIYVCGIALDHIPR